MGHWPEVCKKSLQAMVADMQQGLQPEFFQKFSIDQLRTLSPRELEWCGRLPQPLFAGPADTHYRVISVQPMTVAIPVTYGLGFGSEVRGPLPRRGGVLDIHYAIDPPVPGAVAAIGSGPLLLKDGAWFEDRHAPAPDERNVQWPVIAIGTMPGGTLAFVSVDGRHPERSIGMTRPEFAELLQRFHLIDAMALDSGGSVTLVSRAPGNSSTTVRNVPSDFDQERYVTDALFVYSTAPLGTIVTTPRPHVEPTPLK